MLIPSPQSTAESNPIVVFGSGERALDLLRLAVLRSDAVTAVTERPEDRTRRFIDRFAVELRERAPRPDDVDGAAAVLIALGDIAAENDLVRAARRRGVPVYVADRPLVSDFTALELLDQRPFSLLAA